MTPLALQAAQFRSWARLALTLDGRPVAIHGPNGSGKTNILEALSMLAPGRGLRSASAAEQARQGAGAGWRIRARLGETEVETAAPPDGVRTVTLAGKAAPQAVLGRLVRVIWLTPAMDRLWTEAPEGRRRFLDRLALSFVPAHAEAAQAYDRALRERNRLLREQVDDTRWFAALESQMAEAGAVLTANRLAALDRIRAAQAAADPAFPAATLTLLPGEGAGNDPDPGSIAARLAGGRARDLAAGRTLTGPHRADLGAVWGPDATPAAHSSTGEQKALLLSLILANARALADAPVLLLLDEVAAHLDAGRRAALHAALSALPAQAVLTGTGPELFDDLPDAQILSVRRDDAISGLA